MVILRRALPNVSCNLNEIRCVPLQSSHSASAQYLNWLKTTALKGVENNELFPGIKMFYHVENDTVKVFQNALNDGLRVLGNDKCNTKHCWQWWPIKRIG